MASDVDGRIQGQVSGCMLGLSDDPTTLKASLSCRCAGWLSDRGSPRQCLLCARRIHRQILVLSALGPAGRRNMRLETAPLHVERAVRTNRPQDPTRGSHIRVPAGTPASALSADLVHSHSHAAAVCCPMAAKPQTACMSSTWRAAPRRSFGPRPLRRA